MTKEEKINYEIRKLDCYSYLIKMLNLLSPDKGSCCEEQIKKLTLATEQLIKETKENITKIKEDKYYE